MNKYIKLPKVAELPCVTAMVLLLARLVQF